MNCAEYNVVGERLWPTYVFEAGGLFFLVTARAGAAPPPAEGAARAAAADDEPRAPQVPVGGVPSPGASAGGG